MKILAWIKRLGPSPSKPTTRSSEWLERWEAQSAARDAADAAREARRAIVADQCGNCVFFRAHDPILTNQTAHGRCQRLPPTLLSLDVGRNLLGQFPRVYRDEWCGEHDRRDDA